MYDTDEAEVVILYENALNNVHNEPQSVEVVETGESVVMPGPCTLCSLPDGTFLVKPALAPGTQDAVPVRTTEDAMTMKVG